MTRAAAVVLATLVSGAAWAQADKPNPHLAQAIASYEALEFERCLQSLGAAEAWPSSTGERAKIELYGGLCQHSLRREGEARARFARAVALDPSIELPPFSSPKTVALFAEVKAAAAPPEPTARPLTAEAVEPAPKRKAPWVGILLTVLGASAAGGGVLFGLQAKRLELASDTFFEMDSALLGRSARDAALYANLAYATAAVAVLGAALAYFLELKP